MANHNGGAKEPFTRLTFNQRQYRSKHCIPSKCPHPEHLTWLCIERFLAQRYGTALRGEAQHDPDLHQDLVTIDRSYRAIINADAPTALQWGHA